MATEKDRAFLGTGWAFPPEFTALRREVKLVSEEEDIEQSLRILLSTRPGERVMQPSYGCDLDAMVFETINESTVTRMRAVIDRAVLFFEPRIRLDYVDVDTNAAIEGILYITLQYTIRGTNTRANMVYPFYQDEGTDIRETLPGTR